jgi:hypothetical protein
LAAQAETITMLSISFAKLVQMSDYRRPGIAAIRRRR